ncbi:hypothetical protein CAL26_05850 [Bordetella genomosp. 9]|uniref:Uncharacterized protein n=1 Tax=Bordetella genomosp. 9 TaxID=1416803 RepID=A0A261RPE1_9BORD|nr:hypothetical protein [Bordetella genomosp. 9]OZI26835.1 hypothetical protein CAL26_05850 [Bordetella genomosp. 9]
MSTINPHRIHYRNQVAAVDWGRDFISDQAYQFVRLELENGTPKPGLQDNLMLERCVSHLMALCSCSKHTAETHAARAIAELCSRESRVSFDMDRSTSYALFVVDRATNTTRVVSAAELLRMLHQHHVSPAEPTTAA